MAMSLVSKKWCNFYGLIIKLKSVVTINSILDKTLDIMGIASMIVMLDLTLEEVDLEEVMVISRDFY